MSVLNVPVCRECGELWRRNSFPSSCAGCREPLGTCPVCDRKTSTPHDLAAECVPTLRDDIKTACLRIDFLEERLHKADGMANEMNILTNEVRAVCDERDKWKAIACRTLAECTACEGEGFYEVTVGVRAPTEEEITAPELCTQCGGTGRMELRAAFRLLFPAVTEGVCNYCGDPATLRTEDGDIFCSPECGAEVTGSEHSALAPETKGD